MVSGFLFPGSNKTVLAVSQICDLNILSPLIWNPPPLLFIVNCPQAKQEVFLPGNWVDSSCVRERAERWQAVWQRERTTEGKNAGRPLSTLSAPCSVVSAHQPGPESVCVCALVFKTLT